MINESANKSNQSRLVNSKASIAIKLINKSRVHQPESPANKRWKFIKGAALSKFATTNCGSTRRA